MTKSPFYVSGSAGIPTFRSLGLFLFLAFVGCGGPAEVIRDAPDGTGGVDSGSSGGGTSGIDDLDVGSGGGDPDTEPDGECGDGVLDPNELCDDGNRLDGDGCSSDCLVQDPDYDCSAVGQACVALVICGNGQIEGAEVCDDGNRVDGDGCSSDCRTIELGWACPRPNSACIELPVCGNGVRERGEECDDGQMPPQDGDGCSATCELEEGYWCRTPGEPCVARECGDGFRTPDEGCDDGNTVPNDGCSATCQVETGWRCSSQGCSVVCGDGIITGAEECDDGNRVSGDGCSAACRKEPYTTCTGQPSVCSSSIFCGNGIREPGEICDPPGVNGCANDCKGFVPDLEADAECGNGVIEAGEVCDGGMGCAPGCKQVLDGWSCPRPNVCFQLPYCGDGIVQPQLGEKCDVGSMSSAGCVECVVQPSWFCIGLGPSVCVQEVCGDGIRTPSEACDDGNDVPGDGCTNCMLDAGWVCPVHGSPAQGGYCMPRCGDGILIEPEQCDDGNRENGDGCNAGCLLEPGYICEEPGESCTSSLVLCGNGELDPGEGCDDGNTIAGDGCGPTCQNEPTFDANGVAQVACGDGVRTSGEECDDGNLLNGDGCDDQCQIEEGYECEDFVSHPETVQLAVTYRDFKRRVDAGGHPDFQWEPNPFRLDMPGPVCTTSNSARCMASPGVACEAGTCGWLDADGKPVHHLSGNASDRGRITSASTFSLFFRSTNPTNIAGTNGTIQIAPIEDALTLTRVGETDVYRYDNSAHFPIDQRGFGNTPGQSNNFHFTTELRYFFQYKGGETLTFRGDDDVWVFVNGRHAVDIGGVHSALWGRVVLGDDGDGGGTDSNCSAHGAGNQPPACSLEAGELAQLDDKRFGLVVGQVYRIVLFHAERHTTQSNFRLTLQGFLSPRSYCTPICGDGVVQPGEVCDDGEDNVDGVSGACNMTCTAIAYCGDEILQEGEECDNGDNLDLYVGAAQPNTCAPGCVLPPTCGDGVVQAAYEQCDLGAFNDDTSYGPTSCTTSCGLGGYCGDGIRNGPEGCDRGALNGLEYGDDSCGYDCLAGPRCGDGVRTHGEQCDDGPLGSATCNPDCTVPAYCGDGLVSGGESCDYAQFASNDYGGCTTACEWGPHCGDGIAQQPYEECDEGALNGNAYDGCTQACILGPRCGDAVVQVDHGESCDNGFNDDAYDHGENACGPGCQLPPYCGDGLLDPMHELCDDGSANSNTAYEGCNEHCGWGPYCGDGQVDVPHEECDDGLNNRAYSANGGGCGYDCKPAPYCGDGERNGPEQCDLGPQGNTGAYGKCNPNCTLAPRCGDGIVQAPEACDDGPTGSLNCTSNCRPRAFVR